MNSEDNRTCEHDWNNGIVLRIDEPHKVCSKGCGVLRVLIDDVWQLAEYTLPPSGGGGGSGRRAPSEPLTGQQFTHCMEWGCPFMVLQHTGRCTHHSYYPCGCSRFWDDAGDPLFTCGEPDCDRK